VLEALYHFTGSRHSFTALVHVVQSGSANGSTAVITGVVTDGWLEGNLVVLPNGVIDGSPADRRLTGE
jgi:hypothetical protein